MNSHRLPFEKPFKVGQLVRCKTSYKPTFCIALDFRWDGATHSWEALFLWQSTGAKLWYSTEYFAPIEENDDKA